MKRVEYLEAEQSRKMTRSNPPEVILDYSNSWPLPLLSILAAVPTLLHIDLHDTDLIENVEQVIASNFDCNGPEHRFGCHCSSNNSNIIGFARLEQVMP
jgi:hypothetical protein